MFICPSFQGDVRGKDAEASLTAFVVIAMQEGREICAPLVSVSTPLPPFCLPELLRMNSCIFTLFVLVLTFNTHVYRVWKKVSGRLFLSWKVEFNNWPILMLLPWHPMPWPMRINSIRTSWWDTPAKEKVSQATRSSTRDALCNCPPSDSSVNNGK